MVKKIILPILLLSSVCHAGKIGSMAKGLSLISLGMAAQTGFSFMRQHGWGIANLMGQFKLAQGQRIIRQDIFNSEKKIEGLAVLVSSQMGHVLTQSYLIQRILENNRSLEKSEHEAMGAKLDNLIKMVEGLKTNPGILIRRA